ncbi:MAG: hypothetical protein ACOZQL_04755 [Myxococcota bacterium]
MKRLVLIAGLPSFLFLLVVVGGLVLLEPPARPAPVPPAIAEPAHLAPAAVALAPRTTGEPPVSRSRADDRRDDGVPRRLANALEAVAPELALCVNQHLVRDRGPVTITVHFRPTREGAFAPGTRVETSWDDETLAGCVAEVFDEMTFLPSGEEQAEEEFVFQLPDDARSGVAGLRYSDFE